MAGASVLLVEKILPPEKGQRYPLCIKGKRACPPEDCGGAPGYQRMVHYVETGEDIYSDDAVDLSAWLGDWKPDAFDLEALRATFDR